MNKKIIFKKRKFNFLKNFYLFLGITSSVSIPFSAALAQIESNLAQQGMTDGITILNGTEASQFYFRVPADTLIKSAQLQLHMAIAPELLKPSSLQVFVNDQPRYQLSIGNTDKDTAERSIRIPLSPQDLATHYVSVRISPVFVLSDNVCMSERVDRGYVRILPDSNINYDIAEDTLKSVRGFLNILGHNIRIWTPAPQSNPKRLQAMLAISSYLQTQGREITWVNGSNPADIYIGDDSDFAALHLPPLKDQSLLLLHRTAGNSPQLMLSSDKKNMALLRPWTDLLASDSYTESVSHTRHIQSVIPLRPLGVTDKPLPISNNAEWNIALPTEATNRKISSDLHLNLIIPPSLPDNPLLLHIFQNGSLRAIKPLPQKGGAVTENIPLIESETATAETLKIHIGRATSLGHCLAPLVSSYVQILPSSYLRTKPLSTPPETLDSFGRTLPLSTDIYLPEEAVKYPERWMSMLAGVVNELSLNPYTLHIHTDKRIPNDGQSFIWLRPDMPEGFASPIHFDRGRVRLIESDNSVILDSPPLPGIEFATLLKRGNQRGLWVKSAGDAAFFRPLGFGSIAANLTFMDSQGQVTSLNTENTLDESVSYPDYQTWLDKLSSLRLWLFGGAWLLVTAIFLYIMRHIYGRRASRHDS